MKILQIARRHISLTIFLCFLMLFTLGKISISLAATEYGRADVKSISGTVADSEETNSLNQETVSTNDLYIKAFAIGDALVPAPDREGNIPTRAMKSSVIGQMAFVAQKVYETPPANLALWVTDTGQTLGFIPKSTYAQGFGFNALRPLLNTWKAFRNMSYVLIALCLIVIGFMIMFRRRIDPHTVVTIQNALPRIVLTIILITFSYAIAAAMIEAMYVILLAMVVLIGNTFGSNTAQLTESFVTGNNIIGLLGSVLFPLSTTSGAASGAAAIGGFSLGGAIILGALGGPFAAITGGLGALLGAIIGFIVQGAAGLLNGQGGDQFITPILWMIFAIALVFFFFRILFMLVGAYVQILFGVIVGPIQILLGIFPGINGFRNWFVGIIGNLLTFILVSGLLMILGGVLSNFDTSTPLWAPPMLGSVSLDLLKLIVGVGGVMMIPNIVASAKEFIKAASSPIAGGIAQSVSSPMSTVGQLVSLGASIDQLTGRAVSSKLFPNRQQQGGAPHGGKHGP